MTTRNPNDLPPEGGDPTRHFPDPSLPNRGRIQPCRSKPFIRWDSLDREPFAILANSLIRIARSGISDSTDMTAYPK